MKYLVCVLAQVKLNHFRNREHLIMKGVFDCILEMVFILDLPLTNKAEVS